MTARRRAYDPGNAFTLGMDMWRLGLDAAMVIGLRTIKIAGGGAAAEQESQQMIIEKFLAAAELPLQLARSGATSPIALTRTTVRHYSRKVRANRRRLSQPDDLPQAEQA